MTTKKINPFFDFGNDGLEVKAMLHGEYVILQQGINETVVQAQLRHIQTMKILGFEFGLECKTKKN